LIIFERALGLNIALYKGLVTLQPFIKGLGTTLISHLKEGGP